MNRPPTLAGSQGRLRTSRIPMSRSRVRLSFDQVSPLRQSATGTMCAIPHGDCRNN
jgi:hypothetical protein